MPAFPRPVSPPCCTWPLPRSLLAPGFSRTGVPSSLCMPALTSCPLPPPAILNWWPSTLPVPGDDAVSFFPPSPVLPPRPPHLPCRLLVLSKVWFLGCLFARKIETWEPPLPGDCSTNTSPPRYSARSAPFRLPVSPLPFPPLPDILVVMIPSLLVEEL